MISIDLLYGAKTSLVLNIRLLVHFIQNNRSRYRSRIDLPYCNSASLVFCRLFFMRHGALLSVLAYLLWLKLL